MKQSHKFLAVCAALVALLVATYAANLTAEPVPVQQSQSVYASQAIGNNGFILTNTLTGATSYFQISPTGTVQKAATVTP